jgi:hypothetical protein
MEDGQGSVSISPSGGRVVGGPHGYLCFVDRVDVDQVTLIGHDHAGSLLAGGAHLSEWWQLNGKPEINIQPIG